MSYTACHKITKYLNWPQQSGKHFKQQKRKEIIREIIAGIRYHSNQTPNIG